MRTFSSASARYTQEENLRIGRWTQYPGLDGLPFGAMWYVVPPGEESPRDCHPEVELAVVVQGAGRFASERGDTVDAPLGTAVLLDSEEPHVVHNASSDEPLVVMSVYWMPGEEPRSAAGA